MTYYLAINRGKRSIALDLSDASARPAIQRLVETADVVVENFAQRLGLDYETLREQRPALIYCSISGFGSARNPPG